MAIRYAVYFAPPSDSPLWQFACAWLGRDPERDTAVAQPAVGGLSAQQLAAITEEPRHYGFHATLKAPFRLAKHGGETGLRSALRRFVATQAAFTTAPLQLSTIAGFLALTLSAPSAELEALAAHCVETFEQFRAPATDAELARRRSGTLTPRQNELLARWGYPYVFDEFRFHMTLTGRLEAPEQGRVRSILAPLVAPFCGAPLRIDALALFHQASAETPFRLVERFAFAQSR